jgi:hypothetical protein
MNKQQALERLNEIVGELDQLGGEAADLFRENFPSLYRTGDAYGAFTFGSSWNRYDTTLENLIQSAEDEDEDEFEDEDDGQPTEQEEWASFDPDC